MIDNPSDSIDPDVRIWLDPTGGLTIKAITSFGDPVEITSTDARLMAARLVELADLDDA